MKDNFTREMGEGLKIPFQENEYGPSISPKKLYYIVSGFRGLEWRSFHKKT
jgi:hypothetical protein